MSLFFKRIFSVFLIMIFAQSSWSMENDDTKHTNHNKICCYKIFRYIKDGYIELLNYFKNNNSLQFSDYRDEHLQEGTETEQAPDCNDEHLQKNIKFEVRIFKTPILCVMNKVIASIQELKNAEVISLIDKRYTWKLTYKIPISKK